MRGLSIKALVKETYLAACTNAFKSGWNTVKFIFYDGTSTETDEDLAGIADLAARCLIYREITENEMVL